MMTYGYATLTEVSPARPQHLTFIAHLHLLNNLCLTSFHKFFFLVNTGKWNLKVPWQDLQPDQTTQTALSLTPNWQMPRPWSDLWSDQQFPLPHYNNKIFTQGGALGSFI